MGLDEEIDANLARRAGEDAERVTRWQVDHLVDELGFDTTQAAALVEAHADWHDAKRLLDGGATREQAVRILT